MHRILINRKEFLFLILTIILLTFTSSSASILPSDFSSEGSLIFGPYTFVREEGVPKTERISFTLEEMNCLFYLRLTNGTAEGGKRVSSARVRLNGKEIFRPSQFNQQIATLDRQISLEKGENLLEVELRSAPGSFITIEIFCLPPKVCSIFGPHQFIRAKGKPIEETIEFDLSSQFISPFSLNLINGNPDGSNRVDSAIVRLNETVVFDQNDFNEQISSLSKEISLLSVNTLGVKLMGAPDDHLTIDILGYDNIPPTVTITHPMNGEILSESLTTIKGRVDDPLASVTVNGREVSLTPEGMFTLDEFILSEGENIIQVVARDSCGNQGEDQILVYRKAVPKGPYLLVCPELFYERRPDPPEPGCKPESYGWYLGVISGLTDETAVSVIVDGVIFPDHVLIENQGRIYEGMRQGNFFWAYVNLPQVDGVHPFKAIAINAEGDQTEVTVTFIRDTVPPQVTITSPKNNIVTNNPSITIIGKVDDPEARIEMTWGEIIPVVEGMFTIEHYLRWEGTNQIGLSASDPAGNTSYTSLIIVLDTIPPQINIASPVDGKVVNTQMISVTGSIMDDNIDTVMVEVNDHPPQLLTLTGLNFSATVALNPGTNTLIFNAIDRAGNSTRLTRSVILDNDTPIVAFTSPMSGAIISGTLPISVESSDATSGIASVALFIDGELKATLYQTPFNFEYNTLILSPGLHTLTVRATDGAGNQAETSINITVDNIGPTVTITSPIPGTFVSGEITVSVHASDAISGLSSVLLYVDHLFQASLAQPPFVFSLNTLQFDSGAHTITAKAIDNLGNQAETSIGISFDHVPPEVSITSPPSESTVSGTIPVTVEAYDSLSGIAGVTLYLDSQFHSTLSQPPFNFSVDTSAITPGSHTLIARAADRVGNQAEGSRNIIVVEPIRIEITSPANGATINSRSTIIQGKIYNHTGEIGVVVNGVLAEVQGDYFGVLYPLQMGENVITAIARRFDGLQGQTSIVIHSETQEETIRLTPHPESGALDRLGGLNVTLEVDVFIQNPVVNISWDLDGDGIFESIGNETSYSVRYQSPGIYLPKVRITDDQGNVYEEATIINVLSREEMDALLKSKWEGMKTKLFDKDLTSAMEFFIEPSREIYQKAFEVIRDELPQIVLEMKDIEPIFIRNNVAEYRIERLHRFDDGTEKTITYYIYFVKDRDGLWRIDRF